MKTLHRKASTILVAAAFGAGLGGVACATERPKFKSGGAPDAGDVRQLPRVKEKPLTSASSSTTDVTPKPRGSSTAPGDVRGTKGYERVMEDVPRGEPAETQKFRASSPPDAGDVRAIRPNGGK